ncbi:cobalt ABC transporter permease [uncultured Cohaesibacter sp.]|uniref:cobalt ABC transporter permease n=1 Tax=uncultured Cohaesibacter sp. TaxID=1002546 RepID=UPI0029318A30|nr:cobalt ABC transporter permease [uncultured Cohaesibacter sp.]
MKHFKELFAGLLLIMFATFAMPAYAHKVIASAFAEGEVIEGEIGFSNGEMAVNAVVEVFDENDNKIGETVTDEDGIFQYKPTKKIVHIFRSNLGAGHIASYRMEVDELPEIAGAADQPQQAATDEKSEPVASDASAPAPAKPQGQMQSVDPAMLKAIVAEEVSAQLKQFKPEVSKALRAETKPLRKVVTAYMEKNDLQSVLGGIGYIIGLFGVGFYVAANRKLKQGKLASGETK